jgi:hypothetical protein
MIGKYFSHLTLLVSLAISLPCLAAESTITEENWINHPNILEIRNIYNDIEKQINEENYDRLMFRSSGVEYDIWWDKSFIVRKIQRVISSGGSGNINGAYYDSEGALRFFLNKFRSDGDEEVRGRYYFSKSGEVVYPVSMKSRDEALEIFKEYWNPGIFLSNEVTSLQMEIKSLAYSIKSLQLNSQVEFKQNRVEFLVNEIKSLNIEKEKQESLESSLINSQRGVAKERDRK